MRTFWNKQLLMLEAVGLPPTTPPIEATVTEQKNNDYDDKKRGHVHGFSFVVAKRIPRHLGTARCKLNFAGRILLRRRLAGASGARDRSLESGRGADRGAARFFSARIRRKFWHQAQHQRFCERAYALWERKGCSEGKADEHWFRTRAFEES